MKRHNNLWGEIVNPANIVNAHLNARKGKTHYQEVIMVDNNLDYYLEKLHHMLISNNYKVSDYVVFLRKDKGKTRELYKLPYYPDRIIQHAIMQVLEPIWKKTFIADTYQAIKGRGVHKCAKKIRSILKEEFLNDELYCLQIDISKFYPSIDNTILKKKLRKKIKCERTLNLLDEIVDSSQGVPIGNYISQYFGNLYLSDLDHKIKEKYKVKNYFRYCDDMVILSENKQDLHKLRKLIESDIKGLNLTLKSNHQVYKVTDKRGIDFLGVVFYRGGSTRVRKRIVNNFKKLCNSFDTRNAKSIMSYFGWVKVTRSFDLWDKYINIYLKNLENKYGTHILDIPEVEHLRRKICKLES